MSDVFGDMYPFSEIDPLAGAKKANAGEREAIVTFEVEPPTQEMLDAHRALYEHMAPDTPTSIANRFSNLLSRIRR